MSKQTRVFWVRFGDVALACVTEVTARRVRRSVRLAQRRGCVDPDVLLRVARIAREWSGATADEIVTSVL